MLLQFMALALAGTPPHDPGLELLNIEPKPIVARPFFLGGEGADLGYSYVEAGFTTYDVNDFNSDNVDNYYGKLSWSLLKLFYVFGQYDNSSTNFQNTDTNQITIGAGAHFDPLSHLSLYGQLGYIYNDVSSNDTSLDGSESGYRADGGARWLVLPWSGGGVEVDGQVGYMDLKNGLASSEHPMVYDLGARVHFISYLSVGLMYERIDVDDRFIANVRFTF